MEGTRKLLVDKVSEFAKFDSIWGSLVEKLSLILPDSETLHHWLHVGLTLVLPIALLLLFLYYCCGCVRGFFRGCFHGFCCCCGMVGRGTGKMMKAPGRMGATIPRASFKANPRGYFRALHAGGPLLS